jgi:hypothetical protein
MPITLAMDTVAPGCKGYVRSEGLAEGVLGTDNLLTFPFRPAEVRQIHGPNYGSIAPVGMSHDYQTYGGGRAIRWAFELYANALMLLQDQGALPGGEDLAGACDRIEQARRFLEAHTVPPDPLPTQFGASPPACLVCLPGVFTARCRLAALAFTFSDFDNRGRVLEWRAATEWVEAPMGRISTEAVLATGSFRAWGT